MDKKEDRKDINNATQEEPKQEPERENIFDQSEPEQFSKGVKDSKKL